MRVAINLLSNLVLNPLTGVLFGLYLGLAALGAPSAAVIAAGIALTGWPETARGGERCLFQGMLAVVLPWTVVFVVRLWRADAREKIDRPRSLLVRLLRSPGYVLVAFMCGVTVNLGTLFALHAFLTLRNPEHLSGGLTPEAAARFTVAVGAAGLCAGGGLLARALWLRAVGQQVDNIATSKVRSAARGLVELIGVARAIDARHPGGPILSGGDNRIEPFHLEDETGRVRVEPPFGEIECDDHFALARQRREGGKIDERLLQPGDRVYVLGALVENERAPAGAEGPDRLVVRSFPPPWGGFFWAATALPLRLLAGGTPDVFLVANTDEGGVKRGFFRMWRARFIVGALWAASALWLVALGIRGTE